MKTHAKRSLKKAFPSAAMAASLAAGLAAAGRAGAAGSRVVAPTYAEWWPGKIAPGEAAALDLSDGNAFKSGMAGAAATGRPYQKEILGVGAPPGLKPRRSEDWAASAGPASVIVEGGIAPVRVDLEGGPIRIGDLLTSSSRPGYAMKADWPGPTLGLALEPFSGSRSPSAAGTILCLVRPQNAPPAGFEDDEARLDDALSRNAALKKDNLRLQTLLFCAARYGAAFCLQKSRFSAVREEPGGGRTVFKSGGRAVAVLEP